VQIALIISGHGVRLILSRSNAVKQDAFHAYKMGLTGIVPKRLGSRYRSGRSPDWLKFKNPTAPAMKREGGGELGQTRTGTSVGPAISGFPFHDT
jgi:hypothetical protein